jgi:hypothetical protein
MYSMEARKRDWRELYQEFPSDEESSNPTDKPSPNKRQRVAKSPEYESDIDSEEIDEIIQGLEDESQQENSPPTRMEISEAENYEQTQRLFKDTIEEDGDRDSGSQSSATEEFDPFSTLLFSTVCIIVLQYLGYPTNGECFRRIPNT